MCGILGTNIRDARAAKEAADSFSYRGPDATRVYEGKEFVLVHHRLSIIDLDPRSHQPLFDERKESSIVFNGEIYNYKEIKKDLEKKYRFATESDTEVLLLAYKAYGKDMLPNLRGMFAFGVLDERSRKVFLARDHAGIKPLYYYHDEEGRFAFASEIKGLAALLKEKQISLEIDHEAVELFMALGYIPGPRTLYKGIRRLMKASYLEFDLGQKKITGQGTYIPSAPQETDLEKALDRSIERHLVADVPIGLFFSGGTDSSLIAALLKKKGANLETWSIALPNKSEDRRCYEGIAKHLGIKAQVHEFTVEEFDRIYDEVMERIDEPCFDNSIFPTYFVSKKAAEKVKVVLSGEGGDELFLGYPRMRKLATMYKASGRMRATDWLFLKSPDFKGKNKLFETFFSLTGDASAYYLLTMSPSKNLMSASAWKKAKKLIASASSRPLDYDLELYLENDLLRKTDIATSFVSLEGRVPLLDPDLMSIASGMHTEGRIIHGELKAPLKSILEKYVPKEFVYREKSGFGMDLRMFFARSKKLKDDLMKSLEDLEGRGVDTRIDLEKIEECIERYPNYCFALVTLDRAFKNLS